jgi:hypothetical protein
MWRPRHKRPCFVRDQSIKLHLHGCPPIRILQRFTG